MIIGAAYDVLLILEVLYGQRLFEKSDLKRIPLVLGLYFDNLLMLNLAHRNSLIAEADFKDG